MPESTIPFADIDQIRTLFGSGDVHLRRVRDSVGIDIVVRGDELRLQGTDEQVLRGREVIEELQTIVARQGFLSNSDVNDVLGDQPEEEGTIAGASVELFHRAKKVEPRSPGQAEYVQAIRGKRSCFLCGTGWVRENLPGGRDGGQCVTHGTGSQNRSRKAGRRSGRETGLPSRRHLRQGEPLFASAAGCTQRYPRLRDGQTVHRERRDRNRPPGIHARADAEPHLYHSGRRAEYHRHPDENVPHTHGGTIRKSSSPGMSHKSIFRLM